jgi:hypothetical protein
VCFLDIFIFGSCRKFGTEAKTVTLADRLEAIHLLGCCVRPAGVMSARQQHSALRALKWENRSVALSRELT